MTFNLAGTLLGGVGLFLLGMFLMTNGLRLAAGHTLRTLLKNSTKTTFRGILTGITITSLVQSSSAITVATLGFVNAGLIKLRQAITVIYGSNIGTTTTAWLVALIGFNINIKAFALPAIGLGMTIRLIWSDKHPGYIGEALAGFGVFFLGIEILKTGFAGMGTDIQFSELSPHGMELLLLVGSGFLMTVLMQSSSAAMAIILTATGGNLIPLEAAAAMVIGANLGTTTTALLTVIGATPNAKRAAAAHVSFNLLTGCVALLILPWLLQLTHILQTSLGLFADAPTILALFHTAFNILGVLLLWPLTNILVTLLNKRFRSAEEDEARPQYLDHTLIMTPTLAFQALVMELLRISEISRRMAKGAISAELGPSRRLAVDKAAVEQLAIKAGQYSAKIQKSYIPDELAEALPTGLRVSRYYATVGHLADTLYKEEAHKYEINNADLLDEINQFKRAVVNLVKIADPGSDQYDIETCRTELEEIKKRYQLLKHSLLRGGTMEAISVKNMVHQLELIRHIRRIAQQIEKGARHLHEFSSYTPAKQLEDEDTELT